MITDDTASEQELGAVPPTEGLMLIENMIGSAVTLGELDQNKIDLRRLRGYGSQYLRALAGLPREGL